MATATANGKGVARTATSTPKAETLTISAPNFQTIDLRIEGTSPYMQARFSYKTMITMAEKMKAGSTAKKGAKKDPRDFDADYQGAMHVSEEGWIGMPASAFRNACISACRMCGFQMTRAKLSVFVLADGVDVVDGTPLIRIEGEPERSQMMVRNATGVPDIRVRPMWRKWAAVVRIRFDADQFTAQDVVNLLARVGMQVGIGEGRPDSKSSAGMGFGLFRIATGLTG